jgi:hypothetical protein
VDEIAPGLRRWTAWHEVWEEDFGSVALEGGTAARRAS